MEPFARRGVDAAVDSRLPSSLEDLVQFLPAQARQLSLADLVQDQRAAFAPRFTSTALLLRCQRGELRGFHVVLPFPSHAPGDRSPFSRLPTHAATITSWMLALIFAMSPSSLTSTTVRPPW